MGLRDLKTKQSLVGINNPISDMASTLGTQWADFRNASFGVGPEPQVGPPDTLPDTLAEKSLTSPYSYSHGAPYTGTTGTGNVTIGASMIDRNGLTPPTYQANGPADGSY